MSREARGASFSAENTGGLTKRARAPAKPIMPADREGAAKLNALPAARTLDEPGGKRSQFFCGKYRRADKEGKGPGKAHDAGNVLGAGTALVFMPAAKEDRDRK